MKKAWTEHRTRLSLGTSFKISRFLGVFPLELKHGSFVISKAGLCFSALLILSLVTYATAHVLTYHYSVNSISKVLNSIQISSFMFSILASVWFQLKNRQSLSQVLDILFQLEFVEYKLGIEPERIRTHMWSFLTISITWVVFFIEYSFREDESFWLIYKNISYYHLVSLLVLVNAQLSWMVGQIALAFRCLSSAMEHSADPRLLARWHQKLTVACRILFAVYSIEIVLLFGTSLVSFVTDAYNAFKLAKSNHYVLCGFSVFWANILFSICFRVISVCVKTKNKASEFDAALYKMIVNDQKEDFSFYGPSSRLFFHFCGRRSVAFDAFGFFQIDWQLATTMIAAGCTYVIILVQFDGG